MKKQGAGPAFFMLVPVEIAAASNRSNPDGMLTWQRWHNLYSNLEKRTNMSAYPKSLLSGLIGAATTTILNEVARRISHSAPRLEELGMEAASKTLKSVGAHVPAKKPLFWSTMAADLVSNALYYSVISLAGTHKKGRWALGTSLGLAAGIGAVMLPEPLHLDSATTGRSSKTKAMTVAWYLAGALVATAAISVLLGREEPNDEAA